MKHPEAQCDCGEAATPLTIRWRCSVCGKSAMMRVSILAAVCDGESFRKGEPQPTMHRLKQGPQPEGRKAPF
jgi:hypothetical protein